MSNEFPIIKEMTRNIDTEDLYVCAMGFEARCIGSNQNLLKNNFRTKHTVILKYDVYEEQNEANKTEFENIIREFSDNFSSLEYDTGDRKLFVENFNRFIKLLNFHPKIMTINITGLTNYALVWLVNFGLENADRIRIVYTEPTSYSTQIKSSHSFTSGLDEIFTIREFAGATLPNYLSLLIMTMGYDITRPRGIIYELQPTKKLGIMTKPNLEIMGEYFLKIKKQHESLFDFENIKVLSIFDYKALIDHLTEIRNRHIENYNITIALNGSKLLAVGIVLFAKKFRDIQLILSTPIKYHPERYSKGVGRTFQFFIEKKWLQEFLEIIPKRTINL